MRNGCGHIASSFGVRACRLIKLMKFKGSVALIAFFVSEGMIVCMTIVDFCVIECICSICIDQSHRLVRSSSSGSFGTL